jgi:uncharacterized membrane-anchored protein YjiN (DUF445 family)
MGNQTKYIAGTSLGLMSIGFVATLPFSAGNTVHLLQDGFEAGLVGGLADWFAVTALFRHPLGIPIPHTALLPKNREKVTSSLITVIEKELLNKESIIERINQIKISENLLLFAEKQLSQPLVQQGIITFAEQIIRGLDTAKLVLILQRELKAFLSQIELAPLIEKLLDEIVHKAYDEKALDYLLQKVEFWAEKSETRDGIGRLALEALGRLEVNGLMQFALNAFIGFMNEEKLGTMIQNVILSTLAELRYPDDVRRINILAAIREELTSLKNNSSLHNELESWKQQWLGELDLETSLSKLLAGLQLKVIDLIKNERFTEEQMKPFFTNLFNKIKSDQERITQFEHWIHMQIAELLEKHHLQIGKLVRQNLEKLDNETLTVMLEEKIGKDLQWIRVNGALCGFLIGLALGAVKLWI